MKRISSIFLSILVVGFLVSYPVLSDAMMGGMMGGHGGHGKADNETKGGQSDHKGHSNAGDEICPVSGEKIHEKTKVTYEYKGKIYNFCCPMCIEDFEKDSEKYIERMEKAKESKGHEGHKKDHHQHGH